jgi:hypothetical protein
LDVILSLSSVDENRKRVYKRNTLSTSDYQLHQLHHLVQQRFLGKIYLLLDRALLIKFSIISPFLNEEKLKETN